MVHPLFSCRRHFARRISEQDLCPSPHQTVLFGMSESQTASLVAFDQMRIHRHFFARLLRIAPFRDIANDRDIGFLFLHTLCGPTDISTSIVTPSGRRSFSSIGGRLSPESKSWPARACTSGTNSSGIASHTFRPTSSPADLTPIMFANAVLANRSKPFREITIPIGASSEETAVSYFAQTQRIFHFIFSNIPPRRRKPALAASPNVMHR